ncbi:YHYH domain-containing protein, partial [Streptomyces griseus]|uniref:YHYH domain-containing protein n=3 Tax=Bacillati TaxID=1783272 RepID=UPI0033CC837E
MKKILILMALMLFVPISEMAEAHSGRTDSSGGHNCSEKSKAKGLCTGYHSHNGGGDSSSSSSSSNTTPSTNQSWDKDCSDFATYDEVVNYWNSKGYSKTNDPEKLDGWGNTVDDGIPCEAPGDYDTSKIKGSAAQIAQVEAD